MKKLLLSLILVSLGLGSFAQLITPFTIRYSVTQKGGITIIGNTATSCGAAVTSCQNHSCATAHSENAPGGVGVDNDFVQSYVDIDADGTTFMSSSDSLTLPSCSLISYAGLYWGAGGAVGETNGPNWGTRANAKIKVNNGAYVNITADATFDNNTGYKSYHNFKNITAMVTAAGINARFTMANMPLLDDNGGTTNRWGGWAIVVVYRNDLQSLKNLIIFNGLTNVSSGNTTTDIPISGFLTPPTGPVNFQLGLITYDGDRGVSASACSTSYVGDSLLFKSAGSFVPISDANNAVNDVMNSTMSINGVSTLYRNPLYGNTLGYDADIFVPNNATKNYIANNATTATIRERTGGETYITQVVTSAIDVFEPDLRGGLLVTDLNGGTVQAGDTLEYTATIKNIGSNPSINTYIVDTFPFNCTYVPASMRIVYGPNPGVKTDPLGDDQGDFFAAAKSIKIRIGTGANAVTGGQLLHSPTGIDSTQIKFRVTASTDCIVLLCNSVIANRFHVVGTGFISGNSFDTGSNPTIFDSNGCPVQGTTNTPITSIACVPPVATNNSPVCIGGNVNLLVQTSPNATYSWTGPNGFTSTAQNPVITNATAAMAGIYTVVITVTGTNCVFTTSTTSVVINQTPSMTSAATATICSGGTVNIPLTSSIASTFSWIAANNANTTGESITTQNTAAINNTIVNSTTVPQTVTYTVIPTANTGGCAGASQTVTVTVNPLPAITSPATATICSGATVNIPIVSSVPSTFTWIATNNPNTTGESITLQNTSTINDTIVNNSAVVQTVTYTVTPTATTGGCGSTATQIVTVTVNPVSTVTSSSSATICSGGTVNIPLTSSQGGTFTWIANDNTNTTGESLTTQNTSTINNTIINTSTIPQTVTYSVIPTASVGGCVGATQSVSVLVNPTPVINSQNTATICSGATVTITLTSNIASTYTWIASDNTNTTGESLTLQNTSTLSNTIINSSGVPQTVTYTVTPTATTGGCTGATQTVTVTVNPFPVMTSAITATICSGTAVNIPLTSTVASTFTWIATNNPNTTGESTTLQNTSTLNNTITNNSAVPQTVTYTVTPTATLGGCVGTPQTVTVIVNPSPVITGANSATICSGSTVNIPLTSSVPSTFTWIAGDNTNTSGESTTLQNTSTINNTIFNPGTVAQTVTYTVTPTATQGGCASLVPQIVTVIVNPMDSAAFSYSSLTYCQTGTDPAPVITGFPGGTFTALPGGLSINSSTGLVDLSASVLGSYTITYQTNGICPNSSSVSFSVTTAPSAVFSYSSSTFCHGGTNEFPVFVPPAFGETFSSTPGIVVDPATGEIDLTASTPGTYVITNTIAAAGGCAAATATTTITINPEVLIDASADATICSGTSYTLSGTFGNGATSVTWTTSGTGTFNNPTLPNATYTPSAADILAGAVTLTVTSDDPAGPCPSLSDNMLLTITPAVTVDAGAQAIICSGTTYTLSGSFGGGATSITWSTSGTGTFDDATIVNATYTPSSADISAGSVTLTMTSDDPAGPCPSLTSSMVLTINPAATANAGADATICALTNYTTSASVGGGATSGTWTTTGTGTFNNPNSPTAIYDPSNADDASGSVMLIFTTNDPAGVCISVADTVVLTITPRDNASFAYPLSTYCQTGVNPTPVITGLPGGTFTASPAGLSINASTGTINLIGSVLNTYNVFYLTNGPCPWGDTVLVTVTDAPSATFSYIPNVYCHNSNPNAVPTFPPGSSSGVYTAVPFGLVFVSTITGEVNLSASAPGTYQVTNYIAAGGGCAADTAYSTITINPEAIVNAGTNDTICSGNSYTLSGSFTFGAASVTWTSSGTGTFDNTSLPTATYTPSAADISAGSVTLTITSNDPAGPCTAVSDAITLSIQPAATSNAGANATICATSSYTLSGVSGGGATSATWTTTGTGTFDNTTIPNATYTPSPADDAAGSVVLVYTTNDPVGECTAVSDSVTLTINPRDSATIAYSGTTFCQSGVNPIPVITGIPGGVFTASSGSLIVNAATGEITLISSAVGSYSVEYLTTGPCPDSSTVSIVITSMNVATFHYSGPYCQHSNPDPMPTYVGIGSAGVFTSSPGGLFLNPVNGQIDLANSVPGTYTVVNTIAASGGCALAIDSITVTITPLDNATIAYPQTSYCANAVNPVPVISGLAGGTFGGNVGANLNTVTGEITLPIAPGTYNVSYTTNGPCPATDTVAIVIIGAPIADAGPYQVLGCNDIIPLIGTGSSSGANYTYQWTTTGGNIMSGGNTTTATINQTGTYTITVTDVATGCSETDTVTVGGLGNPTASFTTSPNPATGYVPLTVTFTNTSAGANTYQWNFGDGTTSTLENPVHVFDSVGVYPVVLYVSYNGNCLDSTEILVVTYPNYAIIVPNVFTPNGDLVNDVFTINCVGVESINCYIYDRWGLKLYEWHTVGGFWDGRNANGTQASDGTYFFIYDLKDADGGDHSDKGTFMLIRN